MIGIIGQVLFQSKAVNHGFQKRRRGDCEMKEWICPKCGSLPQRMVGVTPMGVHRCRICNSKVEWKDRE